MKKAEKSSKSKTKSEKAKANGSEDEEMEEDNDEENILQGPHVRLLFSVHNPRETHMIGCLQEVGNLLLLIGCSICFLTSTRFSRGRKILGTPYLYCLYIDTSKPALF